MAAVLFFTYVQCAPDFPIAADMTDDMGMLADLVSLLSRPLCPPGDAAAFAARWGLRAPATAAEWRAAACAGAGDPGVPHAMARLAAALAPAAGAGAGDVRAAMRVAAANRRAPGACARAAALELARALDDPADLADSMGDLAGTPPGGWRRPRGDGECVACLTRAAGAPALHECARCASVMCADCAVSYGLALARSERRWSCPTCRL